MSQFASDRPASSKMDVDIDSALIDSRPKNELQRRSAPPEVLKFAETVCRPSQTRVDEPSAAHTDAQASGPVTDMQLDEEAAPPAATSPLPSSVPNGDIPENGLSGPMPPRSTSPAPPLQPPLSDQNGEKSVEDPPRLPDPSPNTAVSGGPSESVSNSLEGVSLPSEQLHSRNGGVSSPEDPSLPVNTASMSMLPQQSQSDSTAPASDANHASTPSLTAADSFEGSQGPSLAGPESFESLQEPAQDRQSSRERILTPTPTQPSKPLKLNVKLGSLKQTASPAESTAPPVCSDGPTTT